MHIYLKGRAKPRPATVTVSEAEPRASERASKHRKADRHTILPAAGTKRRKELVVPIPHSLTPQHLSPQTFPNHKTNKLKPTSNTHPAI